MLWFCLFRHKQKINLWRSFSSDYNVLPKLHSAPLRKPTVQLTDADEVLLSSPSSSCIGDRAAISVPASSSSSSLASLWHCWLNSPCFAQMTLNAFVVSLQGKKEERKKKHIGHLISCASAGFTRQPITSVYPRCHPSQSHLTGVRHPHPGCWVKKVGRGSGVFVCGFTFSQLPPFSPLRALGVGRPAVIPAEQSRAEKSRASGTAASALTQDSRTAASWVQLTGKYFFLEQPRSQSILHHPKNAAEKNPVGFYYYYYYFFYIFFFNCCLGLQCVRFAVMLRSSSCKFHNVMLNYGVAGENDPLYKLIASRELLSSEEVLKLWPVVHFLPIKCNLEELTHLCSLSLTFCCCCCCFIYVFSPEPTHCVSAENGPDSYFRLLSDCRAVWWFETT